MDVLTIFLLSSISFVCGTIFTLLLELYILKKYVEAAPEASPVPQQTKSEKAELPEELLTKLKEDKSTYSSGSPRQSLSQGNENLAINLTLQFLFNELRNAERVRLWLYRKLNNEFKELVSHSTTGKLFDSVQASTFIVSKRSSK